MLQALIFDVDGTLAETEEVHRHAFNRAFKAAGRGWHWTRDDYAELLKVTGGKERIGHFIATSGDALAGTDGLAEWISAVHAHKTALYAAAVAAGDIALRPGVEAVMRAARQDGTRLAIATTTSRPNVDALISATLGADALGWFDAIAAGDMVAAKKPAPDVFLLALRQLDLPASACLALEDSRNGLKSAAGAGLATLVTPSTYTADEDFTGALAVVDDLAALAGGIHGAEHGAAILSLIKAVVVGGA